MIKSIHLRDWKRHVDATFDFREGMNFVLGRNGSGKSSVLSGIRFSLTGALAEKARASVRVGADFAAVGVTLDDGTEIERRLDADGKWSARLLSGTTNAIETVEDAVSTSFGADSLFLGQLLFLAEGDIYREHNTHGIVEKQIQRLLPLGPLTALQTSTSSMRRPLATSTRTDRSELQSARDAAARLSEEEIALSAALADMTINMKAASTLLQVKRDEATRQAATVEQAHQAAAWRKDWRTFFEANNLDRVNPVEALEALGRERGDLEGLLQDAFERRGQVIGRQQSAELFLRILATTESECPLCRQELDERHRSRAVAEQEEELARLREAAQEVEGELLLLQQRVGERSALLQRCQQLAASAPAESIEEFVPDAQLSKVVADADDSVRRLQAEHALLNQRVGEVREKLVATNARLKLELEVTKSYRRDALLDVLASSIADFERAVHVSILEPIAEELQRQWKAYRGESGWALAIDQDGELCVRRGSETLPYSALSGGEKMVALILLRLALARALTDADFVVLDEPLEHLDPRSRRLLVSSLNHAVSKGVLRQVILSTYEESIARRLVLRSEANAIYMPDTT